MANLLLPIEKQNLTPNQVERLDTLEFFLGPLHPIDLGLGRLPPT